MKTAKIIICILLVICIAFASIFFWLFGDLFINSLNRKIELYKSEKIVEVEKEIDGDKATLHLNGFEGYYVAEIGSFGEGTVVCTANITEGSVDISQTTGLISEPLHLLTAEGGVPDEGSGYLVAGTLYFFIESSVPTTGEIHITTIDY